MRTASISVVVIALALASIVAGFFGGEVSSHPPAIVTLHGTPPPNAPLPVRYARGTGEVSDAAVVDTFSDDDVVVERPVIAAGKWLAPRLTFVIGLTGESAVVESQFLRLGVPLGFDLDANATNAAAFAKLARAGGDALFVHLDAAPTPQHLQQLRERIGAFDGIASRSSAGMPHALQGTGLLFFDEQGNADRGAFAQARVPLVERDATVDDRSSRSYIAYMLTRTAMRSRREGRLVAFMRPQPNTLRALTQFLNTTSLTVMDAR